MWIQGQIQNQNRTGLEIRGVEEMMVKGYKNFRKNTIAVCEFYYTLW